MVTSVSVDPRERVLVDTTIVVVPNWSIVVVAERGDVLVTVLSLTVTVDVIGCLWDNH